MKLHDLHSQPGSRKTRQRVGRGIGAGQGKTSGRGQKGAGARRGAKTPRAFEGGQMPLTQRLPKLRGFNNRWRVEHRVLNLSKLNRFEKDAIVDGAALAGMGLIPHIGDRVKLLAAGRVKVPLTVRVHRASPAAQRAVESAGGRVELLDERGPWVSGRAARAARAAKRRGNPPSPGMAAVTAREESPPPAPAAADEEATPES